MTTLLTERVRQLCHPLPANTRVVVWGAGQLGQQVMRTLQADCAHLVLLGYVDRSIQSVQVSSQPAIYPLSELLSLRPDVVVVASLAYQAQIIAEIADNYPQLNAGVVSLSPTGNHEKSDLAMKSLELNQRVFDWPDDPNLWQQLAQQSDGEDSAIFSQCAMILTEQR